MSDVFAEKTTAYLRNLALKSRAIREIYHFNEKEENIPADRDRDLLLEKSNSPIKGIVRKYPGQALILLSYTCAANCRYCERQDRVGVGLDIEGRLDSNALNSIYDYVSSNIDLNEIIFSGGDPLTHPKGLEFLSERIASLPHIKVLRIHTRFPLQHPDKVPLALLERIVRLVDSFYFSVHIDHPDELTPQVCDIIRSLRTMGYLLLSQSVFLKNINDNEQVLSVLFSRLFELGVRPYYIYHCQSIPTTKRFIVDPREEIRIMSRLREKLSGLAIPQHIVDVPFGSGKVVIPSDHWNADLSEARDFEGRVFHLESL